MTDGSKNLQAYGKHVSSGRRQWRDAGDENGRRDVARTICSARAAMCITRACRGRAEHRPSVCEAVRKCSRGLVGIAICGNVVGYPLGAALLSRYALTLTARSPEPSDSSETGLEPRFSASATEINLAAAKQATARSIAKLDESFFRVRFDRLTPAEREYVLCLADLGEGAQESADVAARAKKTIRAVGPVRDSLIKKGMIFSPEHGLIAFTVPLFDAFMHRQLG